MQHPVNPCYIVTNEGLILHFLTQPGGWEESFNSTAL